MQGDKSFLKLFTGQEHAVKDTWIELYLTKADSFEDGSARIEVCG